MALVLLVANLVIWDSILLHTPAPVLYAPPGVPVATATVTASGAVAAAEANASGAEPGPPAGPHAPVSSWEHSAAAPSAIPSVIWQTYKTRHLLPAAAQEAVGSWMSLNPDLASRFYSDAEASDFMSRTLGAEVLAIYERFPLGVMRADFFRYAILLDQGGVYADVDAVCKVGVSPDRGCP